jgi:hypothetical protein
MDSLVHHLTLQLSQPTDPTLTDHVDLMLTNPP